MSATTPALDPEDVRDLLAKIDPAEWRGDRAADIVGAAMGLPTAEELEALPYDENDGLLDYTPKNPILPEAEAHSRHARGFRDDIVSTLYTCWRPRGQITDIVVHRMTASMLGDMGYQAGLDHDLRVYDSALLYVDFIAREMHRTGKIKGHRVSDGLRVMPPIPQPDDRPGLERWRRRVTKSAIAAGWSPDDFWAGIALPVELLQEASDA